MKLLITDTNPAVMAYYEELLSERGFSIRHANYGSVEGVLGGAIPELWIIRDEQFDGAMRLIQHFPYQIAAADLSSWTCPKCGEIIESTFDSCWNCSTDRPRTKKERV